MVQKSQRPTTRLDGAKKNPVNNGIKYQSLNWSAKTGYLEAVELVNCDRCQMQALGKASGDVFGALVKLLYDDTKKVFLRNMAFAR